MQGFECRELVCNSNLSNLLQQKRTELIEHALVLTYN